MTKRDVRNNRSMIRCSISWNRSEMNEIHCNATKTAQKIGLTVSMKPQRVIKSNRTNTSIFISMKWKMKNLHSSGENPRAGWWCAAAFKVRWLSIAKVQGRVELGGNVERQRRNTHILHLTFAFLNKNLTRDTNFSTHSCNYRMSSKWSTKFWYINCIWYIRSFHK